MKKLFVFLLICLSSTALFAQIPTHYQWNTLGTDGGRMSWTGVLTINGEEQYNPNLEIVVYDQNNEIRGVKTPRARNGRYLYQITMCGFEGCYYHLGVYDHELEADREDLVEDLDLSLLPAVFDGIFQYKNGGKIGSLNNLVPLNFAQEAAEGISKDIVGYTTESENWYILSSPIGTVPASAVTNLVTEEFAEGTFDLYGFDQNADDGYEWRNYWANDNFQLVAGKGYLYANAAPLTTITFHGEAYDGEGTFDLDYVEGTDWAGYNLMGNPYNANATVDVENFYVMEGEDFVAFEGEYIEPMQGVLILAEAAGTVTFTPNGTGSKTSKLSLNLISGQHLVDRAIVSFGGNALPKFRINSNSTKLYIPMEDKDYAVVSCEPMGDIPVSFKASKSGSYTLSVNTHEVSFGYLHLIDNKTGMDVDLLATPSYSFDAQTTDYANRFRLVFATGNGSEDNFAFYSNGNLIINNEGEAMLQVVDVTGRILSSETISGCASVNVEGAAGVYMIRLINGENAKVQKVVVR